MPIRKGVRIKYCGGCNPRHDRAAIAGRLRADFPQLDIADDDCVDAPNYFVVVICGCPVACASHENLDGLFGKIVITSADGYMELVEALRNI